MLQELSYLLYVGSLLGTATPGSPAGAVPANTAPAAVIQRNVEEVRITFSVENEQQPVQHLPADAFTVYDNGRKVPALTAFGEDTDLPLRIGLLVDHSDSVHKEFSAEQQAAERFLRAVLRPGVDSIFLLDFDHELNFRRPAIDDSQMLSSHISALSSGGQTALYDALYAAARFEVMTQKETEPVRRVVILLSDGDDNYSLHSIEEAVAAAQRNDVSIYCITVHRNRSYDQGSDVLRLLAQATGGRSFVLRDLKRLDSVFTEIQELLRTEYSAAFHPGSDRCGYHTISIRPRDPAWKVFARQGYFTCQP